VSGDGLMSLKKGRLRIKIFPHCASGRELLSQQAVGARERDAESGRRFHSLLPLAANELFDFFHFNFFCIFNPKVSEDLGRT
jgi:hypothetical protein